MPNNIRIAKCSALRADRKRDLYFRAAAVFVLVSVFGVLLILMLLLFTSNVSDWMSVSITQFILFRFSSET